jgi:hypothetical protein
MKFQRSSLISAPVNFLLIEISAFDSVFLNLTLTGDLRFLNQFEIQYFVFDPGLGRFIGAVRLILSAYALYALFVFLGRIQSGLYTAFQNVLVALGMAAVLATNPLSVLFGGDVDSFFSSILFAAFVSIFRFFVVQLFDFVVNQRKRVWNVFVYSSVIIAYGILEAVDHLNRGEFAVSGFSSGGSWVGFVLAGFHLGFAGFVFFGLSLVRKTGSWQLAIVTGAAVFPLTTSIVTLLTQICLRSDMSAILYQSAHILSAVAFLFSQTSLARSYEPLTRANLVVHE